MAVYRELAKKVVTSSLLGSIFSRIGRPIERDGIRINPELDEVPSHVVTRFLFGRYELEERSLLKETVEPGSNIIELGGGFGVQSCIIDRLLMGEGNQVVVEANPDTITPLQEHRDLNNADFELLHRAYDPTAEKISFSIRETDRVLGSSKYRTTKRSVTVDTVDLATIAKEQGFEQYCLVADVEGSEQDMIQNELSELAARCKRAMFEFHWPIGDITYDDVLAIQEELESAGFEPIQGSKGDKVVLYENEALV